MMQRKILIVDDYEMNRSILRQMLSGEYEVLEADNGETALEIMLQDSDGISAVLLDLMMPDTDGYDVLAHMRSNKTLSKIPVIVTTGNSDENSEVKALTLGANDYIAKPYNPRIIKRRLWNTINLRENAAALNAIKTDALTGLYTRMAFFQKVEEMISMHEPGYYVMACFDIDGFKVINDQYGNIKGDEVLKFIANVFREGFEPVGGICSRITADYYAMFYPVSFKDTEEIEEIRRKASVVDGSMLPLSFSVGRYIADDLSLSPSAMYDRAAIAKASIKGRYDIHVAQYNETMRDRILQQQEIISEMNAALRGKQFEVWLQPQYNRATGALIGAEALVRWRHPKRGLVPPGEFIPVFEKNGFVYELDKYVWEQTCILLKKWTDEGMNPVPVSVNISRYDVLRDDIVDVITGLVKQYNIPVNLLCLEITESAFAKAGERVIEVVAALKSFGFVMEIDDFGSGYSSLNTLKDVPADVVKLDMRFLEGKNNSKRGGNILESIVRMTKWLGMSVIAEGVETIEQANFLKSIGCNYHQGYLYAKPMPVKEYEELLSKEDKEQKLQTMEALVALDNNVFWDPQSIDTLIFNSYVGGAFIFEYYRGKIEMLRVNDRYVQIFGGKYMTSDGVLNVDWADYADEESKIRAAAVMQKAIETGKEVSDEMRLVGLRGPGKTTYLRTVMRVIARSDERYLFYCMLEDLTGQRQAEQKEREIAVRLRAIMKNINGGVTAVIINEDETVDFMFANDQYYAQLGYTKEQFREEISSVFELVHPEDREQVISQTKEASETGKPFTVIYRVFRRDGSIAWIQSNISIAFFPEKKEPVQIAVANDITAQRVAEQKEQAANQQLRFLNKSMNDLMNDTPGGFARMQILADGRLVATYVNQGFCALLGMTETEIMSHYRVDATWGMHPDDLKEMKAKIAHMRSVPGKHSTRCRYLHKDGSYVPCMVFGRAVPEETGVVGLNLYYTDISEQNRLEEQRRALIENLPCGAGIYEYYEGRLSIVYLNKRYLEMVDRVVEIEEQDISTMGSLRTDDRDRLLKTLQEAVEKEQRVEADVHILHGSGDYRLFHLTGNLVKQQDGRIVIYTTYTPVSESELSFREMIPVALSTMMASATELIFVKDKNLAYICCSHAFAQMVGLEDEREIAGKTDYDLFERKLAEKYRQDDCRLLVGNQSLNDYVERIPSDDGAIHYSNTSKYLLRDSDNNIIGLYGTGRDITQNREAYARLKLLSDNIPGGIAMYEIGSKESRTLYTSDGIYNITEYPKEEYDKMASKDILCVVYDEDKPIIQKQARELLRRGVSIDCTYRIKTKTGACRWINLRGTPADREQGRVVINAVLFDVTDRKNAEIRMEINHLAMELASRNGNISFWLYNLDTKTITQDAFENMSTLGYTSPIKNVPDSLIGTGDIVAEDEAAFLQMYANLLNGAQTSDCTVRVLNNYTKKHEWQHIIYSRLDDSINKTHDAIGFSINVDLEQENRQRYEHELRLRQELIRNSLFYYQLNLTTGMIEEYHSQTDEGTGMGSGVKTSESLREKILENVHPEDRQKVSDTLWAKSLKKAYRRGENTISVVYRRRIGDMGYRWVEASGSIMEKPDTGELLAFLHSIDIDKTKKDQLAIESIMGEEIESVTVINVPSGIAHMVQIRAEFGGLHTHQSFDFNKEFERIVCSQVLKSEQEMCREFFTVNGLVKALEEETIIKLMYRVKEKNGLVHRKKTRAFYLDETHEEIVLIRRDITDLYEEEQRQKRALKNAIAEANAANRAKSEFLSNMSHDMRTPLNAVLAFSDVVQ